MVENEGEFMTIPFTMQAAHCAAALLFIIEVQPNEVSPIGIRLRREISSEPQGNFGPAIELPLAGVAAELHLVTPNQGGSTTLAALHGHTLAARSDSDQRLIRAPCRDRTDDVPLTRRTL